MAKRIEEIILKVSIKADKANQQISTLNKITQKAATASNKFGSAQDKATAANKKNTASLAASTKGMTLLKGASIAAAVVIAQKLGSAALDVAVKFDRIEKAMETVFGSTGQRSTCTASGGTGSPTPSPQGPGDS